MDQRIIDLYDALHPWRHEPPVVPRPARGACRQHRGGDAPSCRCSRTTTPTAQTVPESDPRIVAETVDIPGVPGLKGYLVQPKAGGRASCRR